MTQKLLILTDQFMRSTNLQVILISFMQDIKPHVQLPLDMVMSF